ncbi:MAG: tRNA preQ1(34) S-adenosylmethionine ribosyltransferase-isomerase QueA [Pseudomonadota bacterium]
MDLSAYDYELPDELIARHPPARRSASRLLLVAPGATDFAHRRFDELPLVLDAGDLLIVNDTRVIAARAFGRKDSGGRVEMLLERIVAADEALVHLRASKSPGAGVRIRFTPGLTATVRSRDGELFRLTFDQPLGPWLAANGEVPLPPYLGRDPVESDRERYQTVYATAAGAVAAPTAGLHFDDALLRALADAGVGVARITLHVGAGTFQNLRAEQLESGRLHAERSIVGEAVCEGVAAARAAGGRIIAVGTTSARALEAAAAGGELAPFDGETELFIRPGFEFRVIDGLVTNFHLPRSSLLLLVAALAGRETIMAAYRAAVAERYRFYSYGDAMLIAGRGASRS